MGDPALSPPRQPERTPSLAWATGPHNGWYLALVLLFGSPNTLVTTEALWDTCREAARAQRGTQLPCSLGSLPGRLAGLRTSQGLEHGACVAAWDPSGNAGDVFSPFLEGLCPKDQEPGLRPRAPGHPPLL